VSSPAFYPEPRVVPAGDQALLVEIGDGIDEQVNRRVHALGLALRQRDIACILDLIPTYRSLLVNYDPLRTDLHALKDAIAGLARTLDESILPAPRTVEIPTCYGGRFGPDLAFVADHNHLTEQEVVALHTASVCRVFMMGFSPGFTYLGGMSPRIATPRLKTPRTAIPAGSVGIAQQQTGIYPVESPGGWQLIGRTPVRLFDPVRTPPTLVEPGDIVTFVQIDEEEYRDIERRAGLEPRRTADLEVRPTGESADPVVEVLDGGALTTVQDLGRYGFQRYGVPVSGAMDTFALRVANLLVGNEENAPALEMTLAGPQMLFFQGAVVAVAGGDLQPRIDDRAAPMWQAFPVSRDGVLSFRGLRAGARAYLAIAGGIDVPIVLGSRSTYMRSHFGGLDGRPLRSGDRLARGPVPGTVEARRMPASWLPTYLGSHRVRVVLGPQEAAFTARGVQTLLSSAYTIGAQSDRMGYRLEGPPIEHRTVADILSDGTPAGAVQVSGDGMPLVLLADRGTTGGYAKIATAAGVDLPRLAQSRPGDRIFFDAVGVDEAHEALRRQEILFEQIRNGPRYEITAP
jgi:KipI family sensor histidine kinase inhibitor